MNNIAGCIEEDGNVAIFLLSAVSLMREKGKEKKFEYGIGFSPSKVFKDRGHDVSGLVGMIAKYYQGEETTGIAHVHLAAEGIDITQSAQPQSSLNILVVATGHFKNYLKLKKELIEKHRYPLTTELFAEAFATLVRHRYNVKTKNLLDAVSKALIRFKGEDPDNPLSYSFLVMDINSPGQIVAVRKGSQSLFYSSTEGATYIASQKTALPYDGYESKELNGEEPVLFQLGVAGPKTLREILEKATAT